MGSASPWRIKVTVQAEPGSDEENAHSPSVKRFERTQTTTIPLKDPDASSPVKRGRGRPRKSDGAAASKPKRAGTPIKRAARSKSRDMSVGPADASAADVDTDAPPKRRRGRPRKSVQPEDIITAQGLQHQTEPTLEETPLPATASKKSISQKSTRFATPQATVPDIQTTDATPQPPSSALPEDKKQNGTRLMLPHDRRRRQFLPEYELPVVDTPPRTELGDRLRARKGTPHSKKVVTISSGEESDEESDVLTPTSGEDEDGPGDEMQDPFTTGGVTEEVQGSIGSEAGEASHYDQPFEEEDEEVQDTTKFAFDEGTTRMPDDTTVIDSENFSMISVDSLPSSGGLTSPPKPEDVSNPMPQIGSMLSMLRHEYLQPSIVNTSASPKLEIPKSSPALHGISSSMDANVGPSRPAFRRYVTPVIDAAIPSAPPEAAPLQTAPPKSETPRLGRVVTAGVALQGVLDPSRLTPEPTQKMLDEKRDRLDDLFRGFSEGTRRELQAGLRLGEQLAQAQSTDEPVRDHSSPIKPQSEPNAGSSSRVFKTRRKSREPRLLTPEDQDDFVVTPASDPAVNDVQYPSLTANTEMSLPSPARSENEMSWRVETPPAVTGNTERLGSVTIEDSPEVHSNVDVANRAEASPQKQEDYADIWQEEASRSSNSAEADNVPQVQDLLELGPAVPARGKLPRTWRRKSGNHFQYSDEAESPQQPAPAQVEVIEGIYENENLEQEGAEEDDAASDDAASDETDDTGMFFQSNMPNIFSKRHSRDLKQKRAEKLDLSLLLKEGEGLLPESSPPVVTKKSSSGTKTNPFLNTPPRFPGFPSSPVKSSPLRRELRSSDLSSPAHSRFLEESSLPLPQSSPFHTYVDGESKVSIASDQRQLQMEMEGATDSSIYRVRREADGYLEAYEPQERSLNEIEEVTEYSKTWHKDTSRVASSPPRMKVLSPVRKRVPLFRESPAKPVEETVNTSSSVQQSDTIATPVEHKPAQRPSVLTRMTSSLWSAVSQPVAVVKPHPIFSKLTPLPKVEPWTKTHYKTLDKLYNINQKHPALFSPSITPTTPLSQTNAHLLEKFRVNNKQPYVGAVFTAWGYEFDMTEELVVLCQVFRELMSLESIKAYETLKGRPIEMGDCMPGKEGTVIDVDEVMRRLATVILGEEVRADEKEGVEIDRNRGLEIHWPQQ